MLTIGLDVHDRQSELCVLDDNGNTKLRRSIRGSAREVISELERLKEPFRICYEASCSAGWLYDQLTALAQMVAVAHPGQLRLIFRSKKKNDRVDAAKLAKLLYLDEVPRAHMPAKAVRAWRGMIEHRKRLVEKRTRAKNGLRALLRSNVIAIPARTGLWSAKGMAWLRTLELPTSEEALRRDMFLEEIEHFDRQIARVTTELDKKAAAHPGVKLLRTIPGVGARTAEALVAYIDEPSRFRRVKAVGSYFGLVPTQDQSGGTNRLGHITREGPGTVRMLLVQAVWRGIRKSPSLRAFFDRIVDGDPDRRKIALIATAHHLSRVALAMLRSGAAWEERLAPPDVPACLPPARGVRGEEEDGEEKDRVDGRGDAAPLPSQAHPSAPPQLCQDKDRKRKPEAAKRPSRKKTRISEKLNRKPEANRH
jgi:transposase